VFIVLTFHLSCHLGRLPSLLMCRRQHLGLLPCQSLGPAGVPHFFHRVSTHRKTGVALLHRYHLNSEEFDLLVANLLISYAAAPGIRCQGTITEPQKQSGKCLKAGLPDLSALSLQLQQEWHPDNNALLGGIKIKPYSNVKVMWSCPNCPAGCPHVWKTGVAQRSLGTKCPYCEGRKVCQHNSLATKAPRQTRYWDQDKNAKTPDETLAGSSVRAYWKCPICSHEWRAQVAQRVQDDRGCPLCINKAGGKKTQQPTFEAAQHQLLLEWDFERNAANGIHPTNTTLGSNKLVHWVCQKCPKRHLHQFQMRADVRTGTSFSGCPYCAGKRACDCNSLQAGYPVISSEWDYAKNDMTPADVTTRSHLVVWWKNNVRGSWLQRIAERTEPRGKPKQ